MGGLAEQCSLDANWQEHSKTYSACIHYSNVITSALASQITGVSTVFSTVCSGADQITHQSSASSVTSGFPSQRASDAEKFLFHDIIMCFSPYHETMPEDSNFVFDYDDYRMNKYSHDEHEHKKEVDQLITVHIIFLSWSQWGNVENDMVLLRYFLVRMRNNHRTAHHSTIIVQQVTQLTATRGTWDYKLFQRVTSLLFYDKKGLFVYIQCGVVITRPIFLTSIRPNWQAVGCLFWIQHLTDILPEFI